MITYLQRNENELGGREVSDETSGNEGARELEKIEARLKVRFASSCLLLRTYTICSHCREHFASV